MIKKNLSKFFVSALISFTLFGLFNVGEIAAVEDTVQIPGISTTANYWSSQGIDVSRSSGPVMPTPADPNVQPATQNNQPGRGQQGSSPAIAQLEELLDTCTLLSWPPNLKPCVVDIFYGLFYSTTAGILRAAGLVFDVMMSFTLNSDNIDNPTVRTTWSTLRDLANMLFILVLIFISLTIILDVEQYGGLKLIVSVVIIALTINFSLFLSRVVIDAGNIVSNVFYNAIGSPDPQTGIRKVSGGFLMVSNPAELIGPEMFSKWTASGKPDWGMMFFSVLAGAALNIIFAIYLFKAGFIFIGRTIYLWILPAVSPLAFMTYALPGAKQYFNKWWQTLVDAAFCPAILLFLFWISLNLLNGGILGNELRAISSLPSSGETGVDFMNAVALIFLKAAASIALLALSISTATKFCGDQRISNMVGGWANAAVGLGTGAVLGAAGATGRKVIGQTAGKLAESGALADRAARGGVGGWVARQQLKTYGAVAGMKFGGKESYQQTVERKTKEQIAFSESLGRVRPGELEVRAGETAEQARERAQTTAKERVAEYTRTLARPSVPARIVETISGGGYTGESSLMRIARNTGTQADRAAAERLTVTGQTGDLKKEAMNLQRKSEVELREIREQIKSSTGAEKDKKKDEELKVMQEIDELKEMLSKLGNKDISLDELRGQKESLNKIDAAKAARQSTARQTQQQQQRTPGISRYPEM